VLCAFDDNYTEGHAGDDTVADRKIFWSGVSARGKFAENGAALQNFFVKLFVFLGIANVDAGAEDADREATGGR